MTLIRPATPEDLGDLLELWREMWALHYARDARFALAPGSDDRILEWHGHSLRNPDARLAVAVEGARRVGYALGLVLDNTPIVPWPKYGLVSELAVTAARRRQGIGTLLLDDLHRWFAGRAMPYVELSAAAANEGGVEFWKKAGYADYLLRLRRELP